MEYAVVCAVALLASALNFFSGFGLGTLLLPAFALFMAPEAAVAATGVVHLANNLFKLALVGRHASRAVLLRFALPAIAAAVLGAWLLGRLSAAPALAEYTLGDREMRITPVKAAIGALMIAFAGLELWPRFQRWTVGPRWLPVGGLLSGFFGGLSGHQGALRSVFLLRAGLSKEEFIATGVAAACLVDVARLPVYARGAATHLDTHTASLIAAASAAAFAGALAGARLLPKMTVGSIRSLVGVLLVVLGLALGAGLV